MTTIHSIAYSAADAILDQLTDSATHSVAADPGRPGYSGNHPSLGPIVLLPFDAAGKSWWHLILTRDPAEGVGFIEDGSAPTPAPAFINDDGSFNAAWFDHANRGKTNVA